MVMARDSGGGSYRPVPAGVHVGRCIRVIDLGTQKVEYQGDVKLQRKVMLTWEVHGEDENGVALVDLQTDKPLTISKRYTLSLSDKARLRQDLAAWRGRDFTPDELKGFDLVNLLDKYCMLNVTHNETNGKTYANVQSITPLPAAMRKNPPAGVHGVVSFDVENPDAAVMDEMHEKLRAVIESSVEWQERQAKLLKPKATNEAVAAPKAKKEAKPTGTAFDTMPDDDLQDVAF